MVLGEQGFCSKCGNAYLSNNHSINCLSSQTPFTDDDLKRFTFLLEVANGTASFVKVKTVELKALLARLEAAEQCIDDHKGDCLADIGKKCSCGYSEKLEAWRKTKGEK